MLKILKNFFNFVIDKTHQNITSFTIMFFLTAILSLIVNDSLINIYGFIGYLLGMLISFLLEIY